MRSRLAVAGQAAYDVGDERLSALIDLMFCGSSPLGGEWRLRGSRRPSPAPGWMGLNSQ
jgi:hypothetical protein